MAYQTVKVRREILEEFRAAVAARGDRVNTVLREAMEEYTAGHVATKQAGPVVPSPGSELLTPAAVQIATAAADAAGLPVPEWIERAVMGQQAADQRAEELRRLLANKE